MTLVLADVGHAQEIRGVPATCGNPWGRREEQGAGVPVVRYARSRGWKGGSMGMKEGFHGHEGGGSMGMKGVSMGMKGVPWA